MIRTRYYGDVRIVEIDVRNVVQIETDGWYFVYLFGGFTYYGEHRAMGWKIKRGSDAATPIAGMPFTLDYAPLRVDNFGHGNQIVVLCETAILVFKADPKTGQLKLIREDAFVPGWDPSWTGFNDFYATQDANKYVIASIDSALYDSTDGSISYFTGEQVQSYARSTVGSRNHHPKLPLFYRKHLVIDGTIHRFSVKSYTYTDPSDAPTDVGTWEWDCESASFGEARQPRVLDPVISEDGKQLLSCFGFGSIVTKLDEDGTTPLEHKVPAKPVGSGGIPGYTTDAITFPLGGGTLDAPAGFTTSPWDGYEPLTAVASVNGFGQTGRNMLVSGGTFFFNDWLSVNDSGRAMWGVRCFNAGSPNAYLNYPVNGIGGLRVGQHSVPLIDGTRVIRSEGQVATFSLTELEEEYDLIPTLFIHKPASEGGGAIGWNIKTAIKLTEDDYNPDDDVELGTSVIRALAVFEPEEGKKK
ncbi:MAG: hypothetical protein V4607_02035 [Pseudomonadota bacterium]